MKQKKINSGLYLVVDPAMEEKKLLHALESALNSQAVSAVQIWDNWPTEKPSPRILNEICRLTHGRSIPALVNNQWELLGDYPLDGVHFDVLPSDIRRIKNKLGRPIITGVTLSNDIRVLSEAHAGELDYLSFCSMFPSASAQNCEIVRPSVVEAAKKMVDIPLFLAGGIRMENLPDLATLPFDGVAVISGIMNADNPEQTARNMYNIIKKLKSDIR